LTATGDRDVRSDFPPQPLRVRKDEPPAFPRVSGLGDKPRQVRPTEKLVVECTATDDVAVTKLVLEWKVNDGPVQTLPLDAGGRPRAKAEGKAPRALTGKVTAGAGLSSALAATDTRELPELALKPQTAYFPAKDWAEFTIDPAAEPLAEQDIRRRKEEIEAKLREIKQELESEWPAANKLRAETADKKPLDAGHQDKLQTTQN